MDASKTSLYQSWFGGFLQGLFWEGGLYNPSKLLSFLKTEFGNTQPKRSLDIGIVDVKDGHYVDFSDKNIT